MRKPLAFGFLCVLSLISAWSALVEGVAGRWSGAITPEQSDPIAIDLELKVDGASISGKAGPEGHQFDVQDGKLDGNAVTFHVVGPGGAKYAFNLMLEGDSLHGTIHFSRPEDGTEADGKVDLKRAK